MKMNSSYRLGLWLTSMYLSFAMTLTVAVLIVDDMFYGIILAPFFFPAGILFEGSYPYPETLFLAYLTHGLVIFGVGSLVEYFLGKMNFRWIKIEMVLRWLVTVLIFLILSIGSVIFLIEAPYTTYVTFGDKREIEGEDQCYDLFEKEYGAEDYVSELESCSYKEILDPKVANGVCGCIYEDKREYDHFVPTIIALLLPLIGLWGLWFWKNRYR